MPLYLTFLLAKAAQALIKRLGRGGGMAFPGLLAVRLNQRLVSVLAMQMKKGNIVVSGTNGKTTTSRLISSLLEGSGSSLVHNRTGSNLTRGIASTLIAQADWRMKIKADWGLFEVDEAALDQALVMLKPQFVLAMNLFRDQLDRYGEVDALAERWRLAMTKLPASSTLILNADDPLIASLAQGATAQVVFYGVTPDNTTKTLSQHADSRRCPVCGSQLTFSRVAYSHLGHYKCPKGDFARPEPQVYADQIRLSGMSGSAFRMHLANTEVPFQLGLAGLYNIYNVMAAATLAWCLTLDMAMVQERTKNFEAVFGRLEEVQLPGTALTLILVKNPTGFNQVIQTLLTERQAETFWLILNDRVADGRDISWIWDVELEQLIPQAKQVVAGGTRAYDMALRLKYAGIEPGFMKVSPSLADGLRLIVGLKQPRVYCLCTYTGMLSLRQLLQKQHAVKSYHTE